MKKITLLYLLTLTASVQAQEVVDSLPNCKQEKVLFFNQEFSAENCIVNDSLAIEERVVSFPQEAKQMYNSLKFIEQHDELLQSFVTVNDSVATAKATYTANELIQGVVLEPIQSNDFSFVYYNEGQPVYRYVLDTDNHFYTYVKAEIEKDEKVRDLFYDIEEGEILPTKEVYVNGDWSKWDKQAERETINLGGREGELISINNQEAKAEQLIFKVGDDQGVLHYVYLEKQGHAIYVYEQQFSVDDGIVKGGFVNNALVQNMGLDRKRITARTEKGNSISDIYFENFAPSNWNQPNQYIFDYVKNSNKKVLRARVVLDKSIEKESIFFDVLVALANNPELFRIDVKLADFSFDQLLSTHVIHLKGDKKNLFTLK
ncbi:hypothetical protein [Myroides phaeus]|uniref:WG containing repeat-containing protein n=1 Tax=Myroides phaeus TaxID=702745 RepID=A0A1G8CXC3_9FLAO|nr:hypothetical protein [Myroides phaeus]SDH50072.1 hypothetical protein SAMN05421818_10559 [Myroides phaeus]